MGACEKVPYIFIWRMFDKLKVEEQDPTKDKLSHPSVFIVKDVAKVTTIYPML